MSTFLAPLPTLVRPLGDATAYRLSGTLRHSDGDEVPDGYRTDLASVPRPLQWLIPPHGPAEAAAVRHDRGCDTLNALHDACASGLHVIPPARDSRTVDRDFRTDLRSLGIGPIRAWTMWSGVRVGALGNPARRPGSLATLPGVLLLLLLNLWVLIPTLFVFAAVAFLDLIEPGGRGRPTLPSASRHDELTAAAA